MSSSGEKGKRVVIGGTVAGVLLFVFLFAIMVYQIVRIGVLTTEKTNLISEIETMKQTIETQASDYAYYAGNLYLEQKAREYGWTFPSDK